MNTIQNPHVPPGASIQLDFNLSQGALCPRCGGRYFQPCIEFRYFSGIANPTGKEIYVPVDKFYCLSCKGVITANELKPEHIVES